MQRRLECQSAKNAGMIPMRYIGPLHAFGLTLREEGFKGLYRGYFAYLIATAIFTTGVPLYAETSCMNKPITGYYDDDVNKMYDEVMRKNWSFKYSPIIILSNFIYIWFLNVEEKASERKLN